MGGGAVGSYYGAVLAHAGADVTIVGRAPHIGAIVRNGLRLETANGTETIPVSATVDPAGVRHARWILFSVKSTGTEEAARAIAPYLSRDAVVLSLQNGVDNAERMQSHIDQPIIPAVVYVAAAITAPGCVKHGGRGDLVIGAPAGTNNLGAALDEIAARFGDAGIPVRISDNIEGELWAKLVMNCAYNAISALIPLNYGRLIATPQARRIMRDVVEEIEQVAAAKRIRIPGENLIESVYRLADAMPTATSSTAQDIARRRRTEIDHINGYIARQGEILGIPTAVNRTLHALVKLLETTA
jgi:2-dehydropantoate 2-reductase